MSPKKIKK